MPKYFDYPRVAAEAGISQQDLDAMACLVAADYLKDSMLYELRLLRTCSAIKEGACTVAEALKPERTGDLPVRRVPQ
ncbi:MAG TPA: hypothetical protein VM031_05150 [Phycisphaerae bacterium]|nr:hypothetical protein [Phycisphaerae bacterium]